MFGDAEGGGSPMQQVDCSSYSYPKVRKRIKHRTEQDITLNRYLLIVKRQKPLSFISDAFALYRIWRRAILPSPCNPRRFRSGSAHAKITETSIRCHASIRELYPSICKTPKAPEFHLGGHCFVLNLAPCYLARTLWSKYCCRSGS